MFANTNWDRRRESLNSEIPDFPLRYAGYAEGKTPQGIGS